MEPRRNNFFGLLYFFTIITIIIVSGIDANDYCKNLASRFIQLKENHQYHFEDCQFVELHFDEHTKSDNLKVTIQSITGKVIETLNLYESSGFLADFATPVYLSHVQSYKTVRRLIKVANYNFTKTTISGVAPNLGYMTLFHDTSKLASLMHLFKNPSDFSLEGNIGDYVLRRLPRNTNDGYYQYVYVQLLENNENNAAAWTAVTVPPPEIFNLGTPVKQIYARILVILDLQSDFNKPPEEVIKLVLMFYNRFDMLYSNFTSPIIRICIKGIVIPESGNPSPMMGSISPNSTKIYYDRLNELADWVYNHKEYLDINNHDIVNLMTEREIFIPSVTDPKVSKIETLSDHRICDDDGPSIIASCHVNFQSGHGILLSHFFYLLTSWTFGHSIAHDCSNVLVYKIETNFNPPYWPTCIIKEYAKYFKTEACLSLNRL